MSRMKSTSQQLRERDKNASQKSGIPEMTKSIGNLKFTVMTVSKWLEESEKSVFCNVVKTGDIVELETADGSQWGVGIKNSNSRNTSPEAIQIATYRPEQKKVVCAQLEQFWPSGHRIRINNQSDRTTPFHNEQEIIQQINYAVKEATKLKWHNSQHFAHWCRHGEKLGVKHHRQVSDMAKWGNLSASAGAWMFMKSKRQRHNTE